MLQMPTNAAAKLRMLTLADNLHIASCKFNAEVLVIVFIRAVKLEAGSE